jgi:anti-anti-sigma regulatory factor
MKKAHITTEALKPGDKTSGKILLEGELTLNNAGEIKTKLYEALKKYPLLKISVRNITAIDLSGIQLLYSLSKTAAEMKRSVTFEIALPPETAALFQKAGFGSLLKNQAYVEQLPVQ